MEGLILALFLGFYLKKWNYLYKNHHLSNYSSRYQKYNEFYRYDNYVSQGNYNYKTIITIQKVIYESLIM